MKTQEASPARDDHGAKPGRSLPRFASRLRDADARAALVITALVAASVWGLAAIPLRGGFALDLRQGDDVGGWSQLTLVGFTVAQPFGRAIPDQPGRRDVRIVSNRPLPASFELALDAWWRDAAPPSGAIEVAIGRHTRTLSFGDEASREVVRLENPDGERTISLRLASDDELAVRQLEIRPVEAGS